MAALPKIFLIGPMGAGKTTVGRKLAQRLGAEFIDSDQEVERRTGVDIPYIFEKEGEAGFRRREKAVIEELSQRENVVLATGGGAILDTDTRSALAARGIVVYLHATLRQQLDRTRRSDNRPLLQNVSDREAVLKSLMETREPLYQEIADLVVETDRRSSAAVVNEIESHLNRPANA